MKRIQLSETELTKLIKRVINEDRQLLNEEKTCREAWGECMDWADGVGSHAEQICDDEWCECEGLGGGCSGMVGPSGPKGQQTNKSIGGGCNECTEDSDCDTSYDVGKCDDAGCCEGTATMSRIRARALSESDLRRLIKRVINEEETEPTGYKTKPIGGFTLCCLWLCDECTWTWGGGQWNPPPGTIGTAGKYVNVAPNISNKNNINLKAKPSSTDNDGPCCPDTFNPSTNRHAMNPCGGYDVNTNDFYTGTGCGFGPKEPRGDTMAEQQRGYGKRLSRLWCCEWGIIVGNP